MLKPRRSRRRTRWATGRAQKQQELAQWNERRNQEKQEERAREDEDRKRGNEAVPPERGNEAVPPEREAVPVNGGEAAGSPLSEDVRRFLGLARSAEATPHEKRLYLASAIACQREKARENPSAENIASVTALVYDSAELRLAERKGRLNELANLTAAALDKRVRDRQEELDDYLGGTAASAGRAERIFRQMDRTWRFAKDSPEYTEMKRAVREIGSMDEPAEPFDHYLASESAQAYVMKNLRKAYSEAGMTRMSCALAFLKQTMKPAAFRAYCNNLNVHRGVASNDVANPRHIDPDEVGTVREVYQAIRERIGACVRSKQDPSRRDLAMLTALKRLEARSADGEDAVVVHETLQAEIEKVQQDRRFTDAMERMSGRELAQMAWDGNLDTLDGYARGLDDFQKQYLENEKRRELLEQREEEARRDAEEQRRAQEEQERREAEERLRREAEERQAREERERAEQREREEAARKWRETHKPISELYEELSDDLDAIFSPLYVLNDLDNSGAKQPEAVFAGLIALRDIYIAANTQGKRDDDPVVDLVALKQRTDALAKDPLVIQMSRDYPQNPRYISGFQSIRDGVQKDIDSGKISADLRKRYVAAIMSRDLGRNYYALDAERKMTPEERKAAAERKAAEEREKHSFRAVYRDRKVQTASDVIINRNANYQDAGRFVAMAVALREQKKDDGDVVDNGLFGKRWNEFKDDPAILRLGQTLAGHSFDRELNALKGIQDPEQRCRACIDSVYDLYLEKIKHQQKQNDENQDKKGSGGPQLGG